MHWQAQSESRVTLASWHIAIGVALGLWLCAPPRTSQGQDPPVPDREAASPIGQFVSVPGTVDDGAYGRVSRAALALQARAQQEKRRGVLVLEITPGSSPFHQVQGLAKFLTNGLSSLTTVAWIPETVTGHNVVLALACQEIVMHPRAELGDIGLGSALDPTDQAFVLNLVNRRHNRKVNEALALAMLDRQKELLWVQVEQGAPPHVTRETRILSRAGVDDLARANASIPDVKTVKESGAPGQFSGERARSYDMLAVHLAQSREEVGALYNLSREAMRETHTVGEAPRARLIKIDNRIDAMLEQFVIRQIERAVGAGVNLLIFEIDSPGGGLMESLNLSNTIADLHDRKVRTVAYVPRQAFSGAAIIALGCDEIYLHPTALIGDAGPLEVRPGQPFERAPEKILSPLREALRMLAERKHRPPALAMSMSDKDLAVFEVTHRDTGRVSFMTDDEIHNSNGEWIKGRQVPETGNEKLLTIDGRRAETLQLAEAPVRDFAELKARLGVPPDAEVAVSTRTWLDGLIFTLNTPWATTLLFILGILCVYMEAHLPSGLFGILACLCFGIFFWSRFLGGTAGWLEVVLFLLGVGCLAIEFFVLPGFGVFGISGAILCLVSLIMACQTFVIPASAGDVRILARSVGTLSGAVVGTVVLAALISRYLPSLPLFNEMILTPPGAEANLAEPRLRPDLLEGAMANPLLERDRTLLGRHGVATTVLRPAGKARIDDELIDVISEGPFVSAGRQIEVVAVAGNRVVVRETA
ncbi:MAG: NfeD family protein [Planctomycetales bacterium]